MLPKFYGNLADEAKSLAQKAQAIKIPKSNRGKWEVEYQYDCDQRFCGFTFVKADALLSSETKCNTLADLIIGTADQDLRECCHAMLFAFVG